MGTSLAFRMESHHDRDIIIVYAIVIDRRLEKLRVLFKPSWVRSRGRSADTVISLPFGYVQWT